MRANYLHGFILAIFESMLFSLPFSVYHTRLVCVTGFHLSATVCLPATYSQRGQYNVAVAFDRRRIISCNCTCNSSAYWCSHIVAVCLHRIHLVSGIQLKFYLHLTIFYSEIDTYVLLHTKLPQMNVTQSNLYITLV